MRLFNADGSVEFDEHKQDNCLRPPEKHFKSIFWSDAFVCSITEEEKCLRFVTDIHRLLQKRTEMMF